ncbi:MAG: hypothetical protein IH586_08335 [Anaerolineaceae bacterium]|nr:hypothetical protein [Anaerolineaceae bacterium]
MLFARDNPDERLRVVDTLCEALADFQSAEITYNTILIDFLISLKAVEAAPLIKPIYEADRVDPVFVGDWEDFQVKVGLLKERLTSRANHQVSPASFSDGISDPSGFTESTKKGKEDQKTKKKRKQALQSKKTSRRKKKK